MPSPPPPSCCLCPEVEYNAGTTTLKTENVIGYVTDIVLSPLLVSEDNPHCRLCETMGDLEVIQVMVVELLLFLLHLQNNVLMVMLLLKEVEIVLTEITMLIN